jgi:cytochrome P450 family 6
LEINLISGLENEDSEFFQNGRKLFDLSTYQLLRFMFAVDNPKIARKLGIPLNDKKLGKYFLNVFLQTLENREKNKIDRNDFVSLLLALKDSFKPSQLAAESLIMYGGGYETSSTLMTFTLYELALNQSIQNRLRDELMEEIERNDGKLTYDLLFSCKYLDMIISEALRKYPPIPDNMRKCVKDYKIPNTNLIIQEGSVIHINTYSFHHDPDYFPDPEKFDPERFNDENARNIKQFTYFPFGEGPRICIGKRQVIS